MSWKESLVSCRTAAVAAERYNKASGFHCLTCGKQDHKWRECFDICQHCDTANHYMRQCPLQPDIYRDMEQAKRFQAMSGYAHSAHLSYDSNQKKILDSLESNFSFDRAWARLRKQRAQVSELQAELQELRSQFAEKERAVRAECQSEILRLKEMHWREKEALAMAASEATEKAHGIDFDNPVTAESLRAAEQSMASGL
jgi:hypothetical protein